VGNFSDRHRGISKIAGSGGDMDVGMSVHPAGDGA
jgi:hypothetical protein